MVSVCRNGYPERYCALTKVGSDRRLAYLKKGSMREVMKSSINGKAGLVF